MTIKGCVALAALGVLLAAGCSGQQSADQAAKSGAAASKPYTLQWCVVSGEKLGEMGEPVTRVYGDRTVTFCCKACIKEFEQDQSRFLARIDSASAGLIQQPPEG